MSKYGCDQGFNCMGKCLLRKKSNYELRIMNYELCITTMPLVLADSRKRGKLGRSALNNPRLCGCESSE